MDHELGQVALMLILAVKTRWSSTHQMLSEFGFIFSGNINRHLVQGGQSITVPSSTTSSLKTGICTI
jgi:hypothetical protein